MMKYGLYFLSCLLVLGLYGCSQTPAIPKDDVPLRISEETDSIPEKTDATPETLQPEILEESTPPKDEPAKESLPEKSVDTAQEKPATQETDQKEMDVPHTDSNGEGCPLAEEVHSLCVLPKDALGSNPQQIDPKLYAIFKNVMQELLAREKGTITVEILNNGKRSMQEFMYDISNAVGKDGKIDPSKEIEASLEHIDTIQTNMYATNERESFEQYRSYEKLMKNMISPLIQESFLPENLSSITSETVEDVVTITSKYTPSSMEKLSAQALADAENTIVSMEITVHGEIHSVTVEQTNGEGQSQETVSRLYYTFS